MTRSKKARRVLNPPLNTAGPMSASVFLALSVKQQKSKLIKRLNKIAIALVIVNSPQIFYILRVRISQRFFPD